MSDASKQRLDNEFSTQTSKRPDHNEAADGNNGDLPDQATSRVARLEAALAITGGTVHDVNNLLTVLSGNLYMLTELVRKQENLYEKVRAARNTADKCGSLMHELLTFSRDPDNENQVICPANHVKALEPLLRRGMRRLR